MAYNYLRNFLDPIDFHIDINSKMIHITHYEKILTLGSNKIIIKAKSRKITLEGRDFSLKKLADRELLILGSLNNLEIKYE